MDAAIFKRRLVSHDENGYLTVKLGKTTESCCCCCCLLSALTAASAAVPRLIYAKSSVIWDALTFQIAYVHIPYDTLQPNLIFIQNEIQTLSLWSFCIKRKIEM